MKSVTHLPETNLQTPLMKKFINLLMAAGKKSTALKIFRATCFQFQKEIDANKKKQPNIVTAVLSKKKQKQVQKHVVSLKQTLAPPKLAWKRKRKLVSHLQIAVKNVQPSLEGRKCRIGGTTKLVPAVVSPERGRSLALRWIIESAIIRKKAHKAQPFSKCLAQELLDAYQKQGKPRQRRNQYHKICSTNRGFLRYRWW